jgi:hypothetical protein
VNPDPRPKKSVALSHGFEIESNHTYVRYYGGCSNTKKQYWMRNCSIPSQQGGEQIEEIYFDRRKADTNELCTCTLLAEIHTHPFPQKHT